MAKLVISALLLPLLGGCQTTAIADVRATIHGLIEADNASDADRAAAYYAEDAVLMPPSGPTVVGREAIKLRYRDGFRQFRLRVSVSSEETRVADGLAVDRGVTRGDFVWRDGREPTPFADRYLMVLRWTEDGWRVAVLMWTPLERAEAVSHGASAGE